MTASALKLNSSPIGPYLGLMQNLNREEKLAVVAFLVDTMQREGAEVKDPKKAPRQVPASFKKLRGMVSVSQEEIDADERLAYLMER